SALPDALAAERQVSAALAEHAVGHGDIEEIAERIDAAAPTNVEFCLLKGRSALVLDDLHLGAVADHRVAGRDLADAPHVQPNTGEEAERMSAGGRLRIAEHDADALAKLVDEDHAGVRAARLGRELAHAAAHQA